MKVPISWLKDYVDIGIPIDELAGRLTLAGMEVEHIEYYGVPGSDLVWDREKVVIAQIVEVKPHPNADRLVLADVNYGASLHQVVTGAPNIFHLKGQGPLANGPKVVFAREGSVLYDGHQAGQVKITLKPAKLRGVKSDSMVCSEKELGLSDEHEGIILLDDSAPVGTPAADYLGDVVLDIAILPNIARAASILGVARETAALTGQPLKQPPYELHGTGPQVKEGVGIEILDPDLCSRFTATIVRNVKIAPSPYWVQRRLRLAGQRPISNLVDVSNYVMFDLGQPIHTYDYDKLLRRAKAHGDAIPTIIIRRAKAGERMATLDNVDRELNSDNLMICDTMGPIGVGGIMGGLETEIDDQTTDVLIEAANFNYINIRKTTQQMKLPSEAASRFGRGIHPAMAVRGNIRSAQMIQQLAGGTIDSGLLDNYADPAETVTVTLPVTEVKRSLGFDIEIEKIAQILGLLEFESKIEKQKSELVVTAPDHRTDISGPHDLIEEIARIYGMDRIPLTALDDEMPNQRNNPSLVLEERTRDLLARIGLTESMTYAMTTPQTEAKSRAGERLDDRPYVVIANPISAERSHMRHTLLPHLFEVAAANSRHHDHVALFSIDKVYLMTGNGPLPEEPRRLAIVMTGAREPESWKKGDRSALDFYDFKGVIESLLDSLGIKEARYESMEHETYYPGRTARLVIGGQTAVGVFGEVHPGVRERYDFPDQPVLAGEIDFEALSAAVPEASRISDVPRFPAVTEDIALVVDDQLPAEKVRATIMAAGAGTPLISAQVFDVFKGDQIGAGKKSLAYRLTYQADRTLTDAEVAKIRGQIVKRLGEELNVVLRG
ncbi:MAG: phenylalanine--tRNA ligase subunit beta [Acidobacteria bacterium]|nr:phenylalanine--tRNA ligase subunit beta [Acidobacteriota bacterium]